MFEASKHPSDEEILRFIDRELLTRDTRLLREHLQACRECCERQASIENKIRSLHEFYETEPIETNLTTIASRIRLQEKLAEHRRVRPLQRSRLTTFRNALPIVALTGLVAVGLVLHGGKEKSRSGALSFSNQYFVPNHSLTPGAIRPVSLNEVCSSKDDDLDPIVSFSTEKAVLKEYGLSPDSADVRKYQIDYLVNPQLGGTDDIRNLWPQPYSNGTWNAHAKDELERHLHQMVCNRTVNLAVAQQEIAKDWIAAYKKYVGREGS